MMPRPSEVDVTEYPRAERAAVIRARRSRVGSGGSEDLGRSMVWGATSDAWGPSALRRGRGRVASPLRGQALRGGRMRDGRSATGRDWGATWTSGSRGAAEEPRRGDDVTAGRRSQLEQQTIRPVEPPKAATPRSALRLTASISSPPESCTRKWRSRKQLSEEVWSEVPKAGARHRWRRSVRMM